MMLKDAAQGMVHYLLVRDRLYKERRRLGEAPQELLSDIGASGEELMKALRPPKAVVFRDFGLAIGRRRAGR